MRIRRGQSRLAILLVGFGWAGMIQQVRAGSPETSVSFTIHVYNYAEVNPRTLAEAEQVTTKVFRKAGVESHWVIVSNTDPRHKRVADPSFTGLTHFHVNILSRAMADHFDLSSNEMGLSPGKGPDRLLAYICYDRIVDLAKRQVAAKVRETISRYATPGQILGEMIAHEIGHLLLNLPGHSDTGIMRGFWDLKDLQDVAWSYFLFTKTQAEAISAEVVRREGLRQSQEAKTNAETGF
jgi:hypothetical protein